MTIVVCPAITQATTPSPAQGLTSVNRLIQYQSPAPASVLQEYVNSGSGRAAASIGEAIGGAMAQLWGNVTGND